MILTVFVFYIAVPFSALSQTNTAPVTKNVFRLNSLKQHLSKGGGAVDGGGGNVSSLGRLLDHEIFENSEVLSPENLKSDLDLTLGERLSILESELPGFRDWLELGFEKTWLLDSQEWDSKQCPDLKKQFCQKHNLILINKTYFKELDSNKKALRILRELLRRNFSNSVGYKEQNLILDRLIQDILNHKITGQMIYEKIQNLNWLGSEKENQIFRMTYISNLDRDIKKLDKFVIDATNSCLPTNKISMDYLVNELMNQAGNLHLRCKVFLNSETDGQSCSIDTILSHFTEFRQRCLSSSAI